MPVDAHRHALQARDRGDSWDQVETLLEAGWTASGTLDRLAARVGILGAADDDLRATAQHRARLVERALEHHSNGNYEASIPILLAQVDGITHDASTSPQDPKGHSVFSRSSWQADVVDDETLAGINEAFPIVRQWFSTEYATTADGGTPNRHGVRHGHELTYDTRINSTKCLVFLLAVWEWASRKLAAEAERRKSDRYAALAGSDDMDENGWRLDSSRIHRYTARTQEPRPRTNHVPPAPRQLRHDRRTHSRFGREDAPAGHRRTRGSRPQRRLVGVQTIRVGLDLRPRTNPHLRALVLRPRRPTRSSSSATGWRLHDDGNWSGDRYR